MNSILNTLNNYQALSKAEAKRVLMDLAAGVYNPAQMAAFLSAYNMRSVSLEELKGFREAMLELSVQVDLAPYDPIDVCGTGGDGKNTFNISTIASFIVAGAGQKVAKHGNYGISSICGSSNLLTHLGYRFDEHQEQLERSLEVSSICYLHAPVFHPAMKNIAPVRKELGVKTFFNMLGPLVNPAQPKNQMAGVYSMELLRLYGYFYQQTAVNYIILHAFDHYDEVSLTGGFKIVTKAGDQILFPESLGLPRVKSKDLNGGKTIQASAKIFMNILKGQGTRAQNNIAIANAALALFCCNPVKGLPENIELARESLISKNALGAFNKFMLANQRNHP